MIISKDLLPPRFLDRLQPDHAFPELLVRGHRWYMSLPPHLPWLPCFPHLLVCKDAPEAIQGVQTSYEIQRFTQTACVSLSSKRRTDASISLLDSPFEEFVLSPQHWQTSCSASTILDYRCFVPSHICFTLLPSLLRSGSVHFFPLVPLGERHPWWLGFTVSTSF